jgi:adenylate cyclase
VATEVAKTRKTTDFTAYDCLLQGIELHQRFNIADNARAAEFFAAAIDKDTNYGLAYAWLSLAHLCDESDTRDWNCRLNEAAVLAEKSIRLDPNESRCQLIYGWTCMWKRQLDRAIAYTEKALDLNPNDGHAHAHLALICSYAGESERAEKVARHAIKLNPYHPAWYDLYLAHALCFGHKPAEAASCLKTHMVGASVWFNIIAASCLGIAGENAKEFVEAILSADPKFSARERAADEPFAKKESRQLFLQGLVRAGLPE